MISKVAEPISFLSGSVTLFSGTVILTGTPKGVGMSSDLPKWLKEGDNVSINIGKIGTLSNPVIAEVFSYPEKMVS
jgi:2-keto-4-pentenoate hydratase/2-oxohepta-3-ene-1,7-dioic acid hydratase in catechol pathway